MQRAKQRDDETGRYIPERTEVLIEEWEFFEAPPNLNICKPRTQRQTGQREGKDRTATGSERPSIETIHEQCRVIAEVADPDDSYRDLAAKLSGQLSPKQVERRLMLMGRELGLDPAPGASRGRPRADGSEPDFRDASCTSRRGGAVARRWRRHCL